MIQTAKKIRKIESRASLARLCPGGGKPQEARKLPMPASPPNRTSNFPVMRRRWNFIPDTISGNPAWEFVSVYTDEGDFRHEYRKTGGGLQPDGHGCPGWEN